MKTYTYIHTCHQSFSSFHFYIIFSCLGKSQAIVVEGERIYEAESTWEKSLMRPPSIKRILPKSTIGCSVQSRCTFLRICRRYSGSNEVRILNGQLFFDVRIASELSIIIHKVRKYSRARWKIVYTLSCHNFIIFIQLALFQIIKLPLDSNSILILFKDVLASCKRANGGALKSCKNSNTLENKKFFLWLNLS